LREPAEKSAFSIAQTSGSDRASPKTICADKGQHSSEASMTVTDATTVLYGTSASLHKPS